jgi:S1-C subfamily serine protease
LKTVSRFLEKAITLALVLTLAAPCAKALESWEQLDKRFKNQVYQLNVGMKIKIKDAFGERYAQIADASPKYQLPVFSTANKDMGYRVVGFGTAFPIRTVASKSNKSYFLTNRHVVNSADNIVMDCRKFYAAMRLFAEQTCGAIGPEARVKQLEEIVNLSTLGASGRRMNTSERAIYEHTVDAIWDCYMTYLSPEKDRQLYEKYLHKTGMALEVGYFLHKAGPVTQKPLHATIFKVAKADQADLALLSVAETGLLPMELDSAEPNEGQEIQVIGYPIASDQLDADALQYYAPTFKSGRISRVAGRTIEIDAPITLGNSGGPVVNQRGKVVGVVSQRAVSSSGKPLPSYGGAVVSGTVRNFAPELFQGP